MMQADCVQHSTSASSSSDTPLLSITLRTSAARPAAARNPLRSLYDEEKPAGPSRLQVCVNVTSSLAVVFITFMGCHFGLYAFWVTYNYSYYALAFMEYGMVQLCSNVWALWRYKRLNCPDVQLSKLKVSAFHLAEYENMQMGTTPGRRAWKSCKKCEKVVPVRSVHCSDCGFCVLRNDHHCYVLGVCVGVATNRYFILVMFWMIVLGSFGVISGIFFAIDAFVRRDKALIPDFKLSDFVPYALDQTHYSNDVSVLISGLLAVCVSTVAICCGTIFLTMQLYYIYIGMGMMEAEKLVDIIEGDARTTTYAQRLRFIFGGSILLRCLVPPTVLALLCAGKQSVVWDQEHADSVLVAPLKKPRRLEDEYCYV